MRRTMGRNGTRKEERLKEEKKEQKTRKKRLKEKGEGNERETSLSNALLPVRPAISLLFRVYPFFP